MLYRNTPNNRGKENLPLTGGNLVRDQLHERMLVQGRATGPSNKDGHPVAQDCTRLLSDADACSEALNSMLSMKMVGVFQQMPLGLLLFQYLMSLSQNTMLG